MISSDCLALAVATSKAVDLLMGKGFLVSPHPKSITEPATSIDWLGKHIHSTDGGIFVSTPPLVLDLLASLIIFARAKKGPARIIRTICGIVSIIAGWLSPSCTIPNMMHIVRFGICI